MFNTVASQSIFPFLVKLAGTAVAFALSVTLARVLGVGEFGAYSLVVSAVMMLAIPIQAGLPTLATREVSRAKAAGQNDKIFSYIRWSSRVIFIYFAIVGTIIILVSLAFPGHGFTRNLLVAVFSVATIAVTLRNSAISRGLGHFVRGSLPDVLIRPAVQLSVFMAVLYFAEELAQRAPWALVTFVCASVFACVLSILWRSSALPPKDLAMADGGQVYVEGWGKAALLLTVVGGGQIFFGHIDTLMLGLLGDETDVGAYRVAVQLSMLVIFALSVVNHVIQPKLSELHSQRDITGMQKLVADSSLLMFLATLIPAVIAAAMAPQILEFVFGKDYRVAAPALQILIFGQVLNVFFGSVGTILNMTGMEKEATQGMVIAIIINISLDVVLIPFFGLTGAALASAITIIIWNAILRHYVKDSLGIESSGVIEHTRRLLGSVWPRS
ncbi:MAG: flippase [Pseudomonadota bacterium]